MGDIRFRCSDCGTRLLADEGDAGGQAECPKCATTVAIPGEPSTPPAPQEKPYYIYKNGQQLGPYLLNQVTTMISRGQLSGTDWAWTEGMDNWKLVSMTPGIVLPQWKPAPASSSTPSPLASEVETLFPDAEPSLNSEIDSLPVSDSWKRVFHLVEEAGGYGFHFGFFFWLKHPQALTWGERFKAGFSLWGFFFGPLYYLAKGLWAKALIFFSVQVVGMGVLQSLLGERILQALMGQKIDWAGLLWVFLWVTLYQLLWSLFYAAFVKHDYYLWKVKKKQLW